MKELCKGLGLLCVSLLAVWTFFRIADRIFSRFRKNYITIESEHVHVQLKNNF
ncbi:MAG: hypothetical protein K2H29_05510 [Oscillospiraceae bacterium]|nr:hypothetical protein [Oscillospiraceae bacterium]